MFSILSLKKTQPVMPQHFVLICCKKEVAVGCFNVFRTLCLSSATVSGFKIVF